MSKDPITEGDQDVSRRQLLEKAVLAVGAATSLVTAGAALSRSSNVVMDSAGRVLIDGATIRAQKPEGSFEAAAGSSNGNNCTNGSSCSGTQNAGSCANAKNCVAPNRAMQPSGGLKTNAPVGGKPVGGGSRK